MTLQGQIVGTPGYMSPEQICGMSVDARSDLFSLGCLLYAMLSGESPFRRPSDMATLQAAVTDPPPSIGEKLPHLPTPVAELIERLLQKNPDARPCQLGGRGRRNEASSASERRRFADRGFRKSRRSKATASAAARLERAAGASTIVAAGDRGLMGSPGGILPFRPRLLGTRKMCNRFPEASNRRPPPCPLPDPIKIGVLLSLSGVMGASERPLLDAVEFAVNEINDSGGLLGGRRIQIVTEDCHSKGPTSPPTPKS